MRYAALEQRAARDTLAIMGAFHPSEDEGVGATLVLLGPLEPAFWPAFTESPEYRDGAADPMDRWSQRVIDAMAQELDATPHYPFGAPPYAPFLSWAQRSGRAWQSPAGMLVHDRAGLMISYRGALALPDRIALPSGGPCPCTTCDAQPCLSACPVDALSAKTGYNVDACHDFLNRGQGTCLSHGCIARRACPVSQAYPRVPAQSAFHMSVFHPSDLSEA